jgi:hypothetical protein
MQAGEGQNVDANAVRAHEELSKARAVVSQRAVWDRALGTRIVLQKGLAAVGRLPGPKARARVVAESERAESRFEACAASCRDTIADLLDLQSVSHSPASLRCVPLTAALLRATQIA